VSAADDVAAQTGSQELATAAAEVSGNPSAIRAIARSWTQAAQACADQAGLVNSAATSAAQGWTGLAEQSFEYAMWQFGAASNNQHDCLQAGASALNNAADALETAQESVNRISEALLGQLSLAEKAATAAGVGASSASLQAFQTQAITAAAQQAQGVAAEAGNALDQASSTLASVLSEINGSRSFSALYVPTSQGFTPPVSAPGDAGNFGNELTVAMFLVEHGYSKAAAAGIAACIAGESTGNPEAVGTGGWGLIGWTPQTPGEYQNLYPTGNASADLSRQMQAILTYNNSNGNVGALNAISDPVQAADYYSQNFERPLVTDSDVRSDVATSVFQALGG
jgi:uncharacterized protein YukE